MKFLYICSLYKFIAGYIIYCTTKSTKVMKQDIHPKYNEVTVNCANCGNSFVTRSTRTTIKVDICNNCHPFYTGKQTLVDTAGRVELFNKRFAKSTAAQATA